MLSDVGSYERLVIALYPAYGDKTWPDYPSVPGFSFPCFWLVARQPQISYPERVHIECRYSGEPVLPVRGSCRGFSSEKHCMRIWAPCTFATRHQEALDTPFSDVSHEQSDPAFFWPPRPHDIRERGSLVSITSEILTLPTSFASLSACRAYCMKCAMYASVCVCVCVCVCVRVFFFMFVSLSLSLSVLNYLCLSHIYINTYIYICVHIYIYIYINTKV